MAEVESEGGEKETNKTKIQITIKKIKKVEHKMLNTS